MINRLFLQNPVKMLGSRANSTIAEFVFFAQISTSRGTFAKKVVKE
jgi:hypothetical protein